MCTRILWNTSQRGVYAGRSMDWPTSTTPMLLVLPRGEPRDGGLFGTERVIEPKRSHHWNSRYASLVTTVYDLGTADGFNERGLAIHWLYFKACDFGAPTNRKPALHAGLWGQLLLDTAATVGEALDVLQEVELRMVTARGTASKTHLAIEDASGDSAIVEYVAGECRVHRGREYTVMTNDPPYDAQLELLGQYDFDEATRETPIPGNVNPRDRFIRAAYYAGVLPEPLSDRAAIASVLSVVRNVSVPFGAPYSEPGTVYNTEYRTVCDLTNRRYFFELTTSPSLVWTALDAFDLDASAPVLALDPSDPTLTGDVASEFKQLERSFF